MDRIFFTSRKVYVTPGKMQIATILGFVMESLGFLSFCTVCFSLGFSKFCSETRETAEEDKSAPAASKSKSSLKSELMNLVHESVSATVTWISPNSHTTRELFLFWVMQGTLPA